VARRLLCFLAEERGNALGIGDKGAHPYIVGAVTKVAQQSSAHFILVQQPVVVEVKRTVQVNNRTTECVCDTYPSEMRRGSSHDRLGHAGG